MVDSDEFFVDVDYVSPLNGAPVGVERYAAGRVAGMQLAVEFLAQEAGKFEYGSSEEGWPVMNLENVIDRLNDEIEDVVG